jgi:hypothetical protein
VRERVSDDDRRTAAWHRAVLQLDLIARRIEHPLRVFGTGVRAFVDVPAFEVRVFPVIPSLSGQPPPSGLRRFFDSGSLSRTCAQHDTRSVRGSLSRATLVSR